MDAAIKQAKRQLAKLEAIGRGNSVRARMLREELNMTVGVRHTGLFDASV